MDVDVALSESAGLRSIQPSTAAAILRLIEESRVRSRGRRRLFRGGLAAGILMVLLGGGTVAYANFAEPLDDKPDHGSWSSVSQWQTTVDGETLACSLGFEVSADAAPDADPRSLAEARRFVAGLELNEVAKSSAYATELESEERLRVSVLPLPGRSAAEAKRQNAMSAAMGAMGQTVFALLNKDLDRAGLPAIPESADEEIGGQCEAISK